MKKTLFILLLTYFIYAFYFLKPNSITNFLLVDDGQVLHQSYAYFYNCISKFDCRLFIDQTFELGTTRFRPVYWIINNINFSMLGNNASLHHIYRVYMIGGLIVVILFVLLKQLKVSNFLAFLFSLVFFTNFSYTENLIRLGTNEPYQLIFFGSFSFLYLSKKSLQEFSKLHFWLMVVILSSAVLIKENGIAIIPVVFVTEFIRNNMKIKNLRLFILTLVPSILLVAGMVFTKMSDSIISLEIPIYTSNYVTSFLLIFKNSLSNVELIMNSMSPFIKIVVGIGIILIIDKNTRKKIFEYKFIYWLLFSTFFIAVLFPWKYVMDRYQLIGIFGLVMVISYIFEQVISFFRPKLNIYLFNFLLILISSNLFFKGFSLNFPKSLNYVNWFNTFTKFECDQVNIIHKYNNDKLYLNAFGSIDNWEFLYEVPIHLKYVKNANPEFKVLSGETITDGLVFSSSVLAPVVKENKDALIVESKDYLINQIDVLKFREGFIFRPIQTIINPPLSKDKIKYHWEVSKM